MIWPPVVTSTWRMYNTLNNLHSSSHKHKKISSETYGQPDISVYLYWVNRCVWVQLQISCFDILCALTGPEWAICLHLSMDRNQSGGVQIRAFLPTYPPAFPVTSPSVALNVFQPVIYTSWWTTLSVWESTQQNACAAPEAMLLDVLYLRGMVISIWLTGRFQMSQTYNMWEVGAWNKCLHLIPAPKISRTCSSLVWRSALKDVMLQSEGHSWSKLILEDSAHSFSTGLHSEKAGIHQERSGSDNHKCS